MREFFNGWKRKVGCALLVTALLFTGSWVRSFGLQDTFGIACVGTRNTFELVTFPKGIKYVWYVWDKKVTWRASWTSKSLSKVELTKSAGFLLEPHEIEWRWRWIGFDMGTALERDDESPDYQWNSFRFGFNQPIIKRETICFVPYLSIVVPLIVMSSWMLFSKSCKMTQKNINEPSKAEGV